MVILLCSDIDVAVGSIGRTLAQYKQKQSTALFAAQGLASLMKSGSSPTQRWLNFECKVWHCKSFYNQIVYFSI